jgi:hypothetical protein
MAIDRIGKGGAPPVAPKEAAAVERTSGAQKTFEVRTERTAPPVAVDAVQPAAPTPLQRLRAGEIDVDRYVELKVDQATAHLHGLPSHKLDAIRATLRAQVSGDPALVDLVRHATGRVPTPRE